MLNSFLKPFYNDLKTLALDTLFPIYCLACETEGQKFICDACVGKLTLLPHQFCVACHKKSIGGLTHPKCASPQTADALISIYDYHDAKVSDILIKGKYSFLPKVYEELGLIVGNAIRESFPYILHPKSYILNPVPLHWMRQRWRGFNQSQILTQSIAKELDLTMANVIARKKFTKTQKDLKKEQRVKNMESAFSLGSKILNPKSYILNNNFLLIDDVTTTGSTLSEAARVLKRNGAAEVICLTVARD